MNYTHLWNDEMKQNSKELKDLNLCLEIGCFEGLTSNYIVENILSTSGKLICVDPLTDNYLNDNLTNSDITNNETIYKYFNNQYDRFTSNVKKYLDNQKIELHRDISKNVFPILNEKYGNQFDFIYIDGDHRAFAVYLDAIESFKICRSGGIILFDDYSWGKELYKEDSTSTGIDKFLLEYNDQYDLMAKGYQVMIRKK